MKREIIAKLTDLIVSANDLKWKFESAGLEKEIEEEVLEEIDEMDCKINEIACFFCRTELN